MIQIQAHTDGIHILVSRSELDLAVTLDCGQCFRFVKTTQGRVEGVAGSHLLRAIQTEDEILLEDMDVAEFEGFWREYLDIGTDYASLRKRMSVDETLCSALRYAPGIRVLRQESFEALISFLISQNNNIPRIKGCVEKLCTKFGPELQKGVFGFPSPERLANAEQADFASLSLGYRDEYILDCARRVADGRLDLAAVAMLPLAEAREALRTVKGVGPKVAECALLFGFGQMGAFPLDTWMKKVMVQFYPEAFPAELADIAGIAQQYLFHYIRTCPQAVEPMTV